MAIGAALGKYTTYKQIIDMVRLRTNTIDDPKVSDDLLIKEISMAVSKWAKILNGATAPFYMTTTQIDNTITGTANPYSLDLSSMSPFISQLIRVVHITTGGVRTFVKMLSSSEVENIQSLTSLFSTSIFGTHEGDSIRFYKGSSFTITIASDDVELKFYRQPIIASVTTASFPDIPDSYTPTITAEVTSIIKQYKSMPNDKEEKQLTNDYNAIMTAFGLNKQEKETA